MTARSRDGISRVGRNYNRWRVLGRGGGGSNWFAILIASIVISCYNLQYTNFLSLSNTLSVVMSAVIPVNASGKQGKIKTVSVLKTLSCFFGTCHSLNWPKEFLMGTVEIAV